MQGIVRKRHVAGMKMLLFLALLWPASVWADEAADRVAIEKVMAALKDPAAAVWAPGVDGQAERAKLAGGGPVSGGGPMSEVFFAGVALQSIQFITTDVALVDASETWVGSLIVSRTVPVVLVLKKVGADWRVAALRILRQNANMF
jgi:hypothetical protein